MTAHPQQKALPAAPYCKACHAALAGAESVGSKNGYALLRCPSCASVTVDPFPTVEELTAFYQSYEGTTDYRVKKDRKIARARGRIRRLMRRAHGEERRFLDVGCNYGFTVRAALDLGLDAHGIDIDATAVAASGEMFGKAHFTAASVQDYAAQGRKADMVYTGDVIEHVPDPDSFVAAIAQILEEGGVLYLGTPDGGHWRLPKDFTQWNDVIPPEHVVYFTREGMRRLLEKHGLRVEKFFFALKPGMKLIARKAF